MKKITLALLLLSTVSLFGQNHYLGVKGGLNLTNIKSGTFLLINDFRKGVIGGFTYDYAFKNNLTVGTELLYAQNGFNNELFLTDQFGVPLGNNVRFHYNYDYVSIPVKVGYSIGNRVKGFANLGVVTSFLLSAKHIIPEMGQIAEATYDFSDETSTIDLSGRLEIGASYELKSKVMILTSVACQNSFTPLVTKNEYGASDTKHYGLTFSAGVKYALGNN